MEMDIFLREAHKFHLGDLNTEQPHPKTKKLSELAQDNLPKAIDVLKEVDVLALEELLRYTQPIEKLRETAQDTLKEGGRIFLCGCGATGRLSILLEYLWRDQNPNSDQVISFMAGGDVAFVHSLEGFEDYPEYGERHLKQLGFTENDLLISCTEGGETPYVIGATEAATQISKRNPYFLYCNPDDVLIEKVERSRKVIENKSIEKICLYVGPMALSGSTRMQASTVLQLAVGLALFDFNHSAQDLLKIFISQVNTVDFSDLEPFIKREAEIYQQGEYIMYQPFDYATSVFTDITERSPTFSLPALEGKASTGKSPSLSYCMLPQATTLLESWQRLLARPPRPLNWEDVDYQTTGDYLFGFDFGQSAESIREKTTGGSPHHSFQIQKTETGIVWKLQELEKEFPIGALQPLFQHTLLKLMINIHSTLIMGRMGRYQQNIMTWVLPTNGKLIDRSARYIQLLLKERGVQASYEDIVKQIFSNRGQLKSNEPIVIRVFQHFLSQVNPFQQ